MTLEQLRIFVAVAEREHVSRAAEALGLAQSAVSRAVAALEARHQVGLFDRVGRRIALTQAGRALLDEARGVLAQADRAERMLAEFGALERGVLAVEASQTIAGYWLPGRLAAYRKAHPRVELRLAIGNTARVVRAVETGAAELGFVEGPVSSPACESRIVARDQLVLSVPPDHPWAGGAAPTPAALAAADWVMREPGSGTRAVLEGALRALGADPAALSVALEAPSNEAVRGAVEAGLGVAALSASVAAPSLEAGLLRAAAAPLPEREFRMLRLKGARPSRAAEALIRRLPGGGGAAPGESEGSEAEWGDAV